MSLARIERRLARRGKVQPISIRRDMLLGMTPSRITSFDQWYVGVVMRCGMAPHHREVAAAHEAGHAVVALTLGGRPGPLSVSECRPGVWGGWTNIEWPEEVRMRVVNPLDHPWESTHGLVFEISGYMGEEVAGLAHPASSPDEVFRLVEGCAFVSHHLGHDPELLMGRLMTEASSRIRANRGLFEAICHALEETDTLTTAQMDDLVRVHGLATIPLQAAWATELQDSDGRQAPKAVKQ